MSNVKAIRPKSGDPKNARFRSLTGLGRLSADDRSWFDAEDDKIAGAIGNIVQRLDQNNSGYRLRMMRYARMYGSYENLGLTNSFNYNYSNTQTNNLPTYNLVQSCVDTVASKIVKDNPAPYFITSGADYFTKLKAEKQTQFVQGGFESIGLYELANNKVFRDAAVYGLGALQFEYCELKKEILTDWCFIDELKIDPFDSARGLPMSLHRVRMMQREKLEDKYPDEAKYPERTRHIREAATRAANQYQSIETVIDFVVYIESWHLALGKDKPGRHVVSLGDHVLLDEEYEYDWYPFAFFQYYQKPVGMFGRGIAETIQSAQFEVNKILLSIQQGQELQARPLIIVDNDSQVSSDSILNNRIARMVKIKAGSRPPMFVAPQAMSEEVYQHLNNWMNWAREEVGITQMAQQGAVRQGVNSAVAMRTQVDIESSRYIQVAKNWEKFFVDCAHIYMKMGKIAYEADPEFAVRYMDKKFKVMREIPWKKIAVPEESYTIRCDTVSAFPQTAAGRIQTITDFIANNFIGRERGMELIGLDPDLEGEIKLQISTLRLVEKRLCEMVEDGAEAYRHPEPFMDLTLALKVSEQTYCMLDGDGCPEDRLQLVRQWIGEICTMKTGNDPTVALLQQAFAPPTAAPIAPQTGLAPAGHAGP